ncbi:MAG: transglycosylase domain-containing protein [Oryzihumus sp.]
MNAQTRASTAGRRRAQPPQKQQGWRRFFTWKRVLLTLAACGVLGVAGFAVAYATTPIPNPNELATSQASVIYYADGKTELARISQINRESVPLKKVPLHVQRALLAAEDRNFYHESGVSPTGIGRAVLVAMRGGPTQGGSTITQQYVKNYFLTQDQTITRKYKELMISIKIDQSQSKDQILESYLNTIYFGRGAYGIQTAAKAYFGKDVSQLTVAQGALLASVINGPSLYDPANGPNALHAAKNRVQYVLDGMKKEGWITQAQYDQATFPKVLDPKNRQKAGNGALGYITNAVKDELKSRLKLTDADIDRGGYKVVTTIDKNAEDSAISAVNDNLPGSGSSQASKLLHAGLVAIKPGDGAIVAMYGGRDYNKVQFNSATDAHLQAGSTFKAFGLLAALQKGISTKTRFDGHSPQDFPEFKGQNGSTGSEVDANGTIRNFGDEQFGDIDLRTATAHSVNTVFAALNIKVTPQSTMEAAIAAGVPASTPGLGPNYANILGSASPRVIDMANAYATIAAQGTRAKPYLIKSVTSGSGNIDYKANKDVRPAFDKDVTADATDAMTRVVKEGTAQHAQELGRPAAGKTGTTTKNKAVWFDGFTPQLAAAVGIYQGDGTGSIKVDGFGEVTGGTYPVKIWTAFMEGALKGQPVQDFPPRAGIGDDQVAPPTPTTTATSSTSTTSTTSTTTAPPTSETTTKTKGPKPTFTVPFPGGGGSSTSTGGGTPSTGSTGGGAGRRGQPTPTP